MKKIINLLVVSTMAFALASCGSAKEDTLNAVETTQSVESDKPETIIVKSLDGNREEIDIEVPFDPQRIAVLDMAALDIIDSIGMGDRVVGVASTSIDYLEKYTSDDIENIGTVKEANLEKTMAVEPEVIFIGGRLAESYDALSEIAPVVFISVDADLGVVESTKKNATNIASIFGLEDEIEQKVNAYNARIEELQKIAESKTALVGLTTSGSFNLLGNDGRASIIGVEIGFENLTSLDNETSTHGNESSFEVVVEKNPDYIFVLDRDAAINSEGATTAKEIIENELIMQTSAYKNDNIVYLAHPNVWYTAEGGITALDIMLQDLEVIK